MGEYRAGGWVDRGDGEGWVLDDTQPETVPKSVEHQPLKPTMESAGGWRLAPEPPPAEPEPAPEAELEPQAEDEAESEAGPTNAEVRAWAREEGIDVSDRGPIPKEVLDQYMNREK